MTASRPVRYVAVVMRRQPVDGPMSRWQAWRWVLDAVLENDPSWGTGLSRLPDEGAVQRWLHPGFDVELFRDDAEGYCLNVTTEAPCWFVMYRMEDQPEWLDADAALDKMYEVDGAKTNPFLHLSMHLSISEQCSIDQPRGIRQAVELLTARRDSLHDAHHEAMECLGQMLWESQRSGRPPDGQAYIECVQRQATRD